MNETSVPSGTQSAHAPPPSNVGKNNRKISGYSMKTALTIRFGLIFMFLSVFILLIVACISSVETVKANVAAENAKKQSYYAAALLDPLQISSLESNLANSDQTISKLEADLDTTVDFVMGVCTFNVICLVLVTMNTFMYIRTHVVVPMGIFKDEVARLAVGDLNLDFEVDSHAYEVQSLSVGLQECTEELKRIVTILNVGVAELSEKRFTPQPPAGFPGDFKPIEDGFRRLVSIVNETLHEIVTSATEMTIGTQQVSSGAQNLAQGSTEQSGSVDQLSANIAEIAKMVADTAENAKKANELGETASSVLDKSSKEMGELMDAISQIERSSSDIEQIIQTIDDIAFQTNILALNAAIEAARAGQFGKSFAVVADEVRSLAQKSAVSAHDTSDLIDKSLEAIRRGASLAKSTDKAFGEVKNNSMKMLDIVQDIAASSQLQSGSIDEICSSVGEISAVISSNSATSEESAAASEQLSSQAENMTKMLDSFTL